MFKIANLKEISLIISSLPKENSWTKEKLIDSGLNIEMQKLAQLTGLLNYWEKSNGLYLLEPKKAKEILSTLNDENKYDKKQIERGIEIEREHKPTLDKLKKDVKELKESSSMILSIRDAQLKENTPSEEDIIISEDNLSAFYLGKQIIVVSRENVDKDPDAIEKAIAKWMVENQYFPAVYYINDHGNAFNRTTDVSKWVNIRNLKEKRKVSNLNFQIKQGMSKEDIKNLTDEALSRGIYWWKSMLGSEIVKDYIVENLKNAKEIVLKNPEKYPKSVKLIEISK